MPLASSWSSECFRRQLRGRIRSTRISGIAVTICWVAPVRVCRADFLTKNALWRWHQSVFRASFWDFFRLMDDANEPKKETVRIGLPAQPAVEPPRANAKSRETVRIQLPIRPPSTKPPLGSPAEQSPLPKPSAKDPTAAPVILQPPAQPVSPPIPPPVSLPVLPPAPAVVAPAPSPPPSGPKKETARVPLMPEPPSKPLPTVQMKKTQPLIAMPQTAPQSTLIALAPAERSTMLDAIQMPICWGLLGISAIILIIQIWTYLS